jgi:error-prone DNA polymerase
MAYAELHCHSNFSFLDGASHPEELVTQAARAGLSALALTDHNGLYGAVRFAEAARAVGLPTVFGAELQLTATVGRTGVPDPPGTHLVVLARDPEGYRRLSRVLADAHLASGRKGVVTVDLDTLADAHGGHWAVLTGCRKGAVPRALVEQGPAAARRELEHLVERFSPEHVLVELWDHGDPLDGPRNDALAEVAVPLGVEPVATGNVHYHAAHRFPLAGVLAAARARRPLDDLQGWLPGAAGAVLRSPAEQARRFARWPGTVERAGRLGADCAFDLRVVAPRLPTFPVPDGHDEQSWLQALVEAAGTRRYGPRHRPTVPGAWERLDHELAVIARLGFAGYFLTVWDITEFCRRRGILCQGRGSAATSAVCFVLGITNVDAVRLQLLFERFLSPARDGPPDIDVDIESGRREEVLQYVYERHGRHHAAQVAAVITYRTRSARRDVAKALGRTEPGDPPDPLVERLASDLVGFPRHLGIHSGGMVICDRPVSDVCPVEWATMPGRTVLQWDKDDCAAVGLVKFDLLGLGMLQALHRTIDLIAEHTGEQVDLGALPQEDAVYDLLCRADTVGVFQVESRAQMGTLPRVRPRCFYDLAIEVALIRPGPIQGHAVHPYIRRRNGEEPVRYPHPLLEPALRRTLGVPLFQEQLMQIAVDVAGFSPTEADELRQAMGAKRSDARMERLRDRLFTGMTARGVPGPVADEIYDTLRAFANFGFPESHALSFAGLVYASAWCKLHHPAAFTAGLLDAQPMGFWSPQSLVADARRHGVTVRRPDVQCSQVRTSLEDGGTAIRLGLGMVRAVGTATAQRIVDGRPWRSLADLVRRAGVTRAQLHTLAAAGALQSIEDPLAAPAGRVGGRGARAGRRAGRPDGRLVDRADDRPANRADDRPANRADDRPANRADDRPAGERAAPSAEAPSDGTTRETVPDGAARRRAQVWAAGAAAQATADRLPGIVTGTEAPDLPCPTPLDEVTDDLWSTGVAIEHTAMELARPRLHASGVRSAVEATREPDGRRITVAGVVTHRQQPESARGAVFLNLEDETGLVNVVFSSGAWARWRHVAGRSPALRVRGRVERHHTATTLVAEQVWALPIGPVPPARNFR